MRSAALLRAASPSASPTTSTTTVRSRSPLLRARTPTWSPSSACRPKRSRAVPDLMHHKYVVRDRQAVWTGSTNWTDDSWSREENVIVIVDSEALAAAFELDFEQLWRSRTVAGSGDVEPRPVEVGASTVRAWFCPEHGADLAHRIARSIGSARRAGEDRLAGHNLGADPGNAGRGRGRRKGRRRRRGRRDPDRGGLRAMACEGAHPLEAHLTWRRSSATPSSPASARRPTGPAASTTTCTPRSRSPTTSPSSEASTFRIRER